MSYKLRMHTPVLLNEVLEYLDVKQGGRYIDATYGMGGHSGAILAAGGRVLGIDRDPSVIEAPQLNHKSQITNHKVVHGRFSELEEIAKENNFTDVDGILFDLGMGSHQLDDPERGFSFQKDGPLDMRYNPSGTEGKSQITNHKSQTADEIVNKLDEKDLAKFFRVYGEERFAGRIARGILETRKRKSIQTTTELFEIIKKAIPGKFRHRAHDSARRVFQSLRIAVNDELGEIEKALPQAIELLKSPLKPINGHATNQEQDRSAPQEQDRSAPIYRHERSQGGRLAVISFHSLEDRIVKKFFVREAKDCVCPPEVPECRCDKTASLKILTRKPVTAGEEEIKTNPRSKSAKLRAAEKI